MKGEVLVKARPRIQYDMSGRPSMYFERERGGARGLPSKRERLGGIAGGAVGVLGALTGKHRSLGGLLGSMYAGKVQGEGIGRSLAGKTVMPGRRAELEMEAQSRAKQGQAKGVERMRRRVERAEEAQDRINAPAGANRQGVVSQLRDKVRVLRTPQYMRDDFRAAEAAEAEREAQAQAKQQRRELSRQDLALARSLRGYSPEQIEQVREIDPARVRSLMNLDATLAGLPNVYQQTPGSVQSAPTLPAPQTTLPAPAPLQTAPGAQTVLQAGERVDPNHADHDHEGLAAQLLGEDIAGGQQQPQETRGFGPEELQNALRMGLDGQR